MKIEVDWDLCQGHAVCEGELPEVFRVSPDGKLTVLMPEPPAHMLEQVEVALRYCPTGALRLIK